MNIKVVGIIQARMKSTRLPGKVLRNIGGEPILKTVISRVKASKNISSLCVAVPNTLDNIPIIELCRMLNIAVFKGSEDNVLSRFYYAAKKYNADVVVRITADNPLVDAEIIDEIIDALYDTCSDYVSNTLEPTYPEGLNVEAFTYYALRRAFMEAVLPSEREHVSPYIWKNPTLFKLHNVKYFKDYSHWRWTVDREKDINFFDVLFEKSNFSATLVHYKSVLKFLDSHPEIVEINYTIPRSEGYLRSVREELRKQ